MAKKLFDADQEILRDVFNQALYVASARLNSGDGCAAAKDAAVGMVAAAEAAWDELHKDVPA